MYRNYQRGRHETLNVDLTDVGSDQFMVRADGLEGNAFYDMAIYSDSGRTTPLSVSDWEYYTEDERKTAQEEETGGTGETVYSQIKILNPTYQSGTIYLTFESFGTYPDGNVQGIDYLEPGDSDYSFTTQRNLMTYIVFDSLTADRTVTVTDGGFDERSRFKIVNNDSAYKVIVEDGTESEPYYVVAGKSAEFYDVSNSLTWSSAGWETIYFDTSNTLHYVNESSLPRTVNSHEKYELTTTDPPTYTENRTTEVYVYDNSIEARGPYVSGTTDHYEWDPTGVGDGARFYFTGGTTRDMIMVRIWHDAA